MKTYAVQHDGDDAVGIEGRLLAAQLRDLADQRDVLVDEAVEIRGGDARGGELLGHGCRNERLKEVKLSRGERECVTDSSEWVDEGGLGWG